VRREELPAPLEHEEQCALIDWWAYACKAHGIPESMLFAIPNAGAGASKGQAGKMKAEGVRPGIPDLMLAVVRAPWAGLFLEMKRVRGGRTSTEQAARIVELRLQGYRVAVADGCEHARALITEYLKGE
jgi:hypothetical protein